MDTYRTTDLNLASALKTVLRRNPSVQLNGRLAEFIFQVDSTEAQKVADSYYADSLSANLRTYAQDLRDLKALIYQVRDGQGR